MDKLLKDSIMLLNNGMLFFVSTAICGYGGYKLDSYFHTTFLLFVCGTVGMCLSFYIYFVKLPKSIEQKSKEEEN